MTTPNIETVIDLSDINDSFIIHYGGRLNEVKANTFANSLIYLSNILDEVNQEVNPNFKIEIIIEAVGPGSFRPKIKLSATQIKQLFGGYVKKDNLIPILIMLLSLTLGRGPSDSQNIKITNKQVTITENNKTIIMPREVYDHTTNIYNNVRVQQNIQNHFNLLEEDESITEFGIVRSTDDEEYLFKAERDDFIGLSEKQIDIEDITHRVQSERATLQVIRSILKVSKRRWAFVWKGFDISAVIESEKFYKELKNGLKFGIGDRIEVKLEMHQTFNKTTNAWMNESFVITEYYDYIPAPSQLKLPLTEN